MKRTAPQAAQDLEEAIGRAQSIFALQAQHTQTARQQAESLHTAFMSSLDTARSQAKWPSYSEARGSLVRDRLENDPLTETIALSQQWIAALSDTQIALMRLYAFPEAQEEIERLAGLLRQMQLLPVDASQAEALPVVSPPANGVWPDNAQERRHMQADFAADFMQNMAKHMESRRQEYQTRSDRTAGILEEMHQGATALLKQFQE